jgi:hypothetical protein
MDSVRPSKAAYDPAISKRFVAMCLIIPASILSALLLYPDGFNLLQDAFSELGESVTAGGDLNVAARFAFSAGWITCGVILFSIGLRYVRHAELRNRRIKSGLAFFGGVAFFIAITPNDLSHLIHSIGMGMIVGTIYLFALSLLVELKMRVPPRVFYVNGGILHAAVLTYAAAFLANSDLKQFAQKLCLAGLLVVMQRLVTIAPEGYEWRSSFARLQRS